MGSGPAGQQEAHHARLTLLDWREGKRSDKSTFEAFTCTQAAKKMNHRPWRELHPREWELALQSEIRTANPTSSARRAVLLGQDARGLAAVTVAELEHNASEVYIECVAVALRCRNQPRNGLGDEAIQQSIQWAISKADAAGYERVLITAKTDRRNTAGKALVLRNGFGLFDRTDMIEVWIQQFSLL